MIELYQAEWCPFSHQVRERMTELGISYVIHQVEPERDDRNELRERCGDTGIPVLVTEDGRTVGGTDEILTWLEEHFPAPPEAAGHRAQLEAHEG